MTAGVSWQPSMVTLVDGTRVLSDSEEWRQECEARHILDQPTKEDRLNLLRGEIDHRTGKRFGGILKQRGEAEVERIEQRILAIHYARKAAAKAVA